MNNNDILEMCYLVKSCTNNLDPKWNHKFDKDVSEACNKFCRKHKINITHGSAYKELRHKTYYYVDKNIKSIINNGIDEYGLRENKYISDAEIVNKLIQTRLKDKIVIKDNAIGFYS